MESSRCISVVKDELTKLGMHFKKVELGTAVLKTEASPEKLQQLDHALRTSGLELMDDSKTRIVKMIDIAIYELIYLSDDLPKQNVSKYISMHVGYDYTYLSNLFSDVQGITISKRIIQMKIQRVKDLLLYTNQSLGDIAFILQYSSVAHLSNQFKKITGVTPSIFRELKNNMNQSNN